MIKSVMSETGLEWFATAGLVMFVTIFSCVLVWTLLRSRREVSRWSQLPLDDKPPERKNAATR